MADDGGNVVPRITKAEHIGPTSTGDNIEAKRIANYIWNGSTWERQTAASSGGGLTDAELRASPVPVTFTEDTLSSRYDITSTIIYSGEAAVGSDEGDNVWTITKFDLTDLTNSSGKIALAASWTNRASESYL